LPALYCKNKTFFMKKVLFMLAFISGISIVSSAQTEPKKKVETNDTKTKVKPNTTVKDKAHNVIHPKHKHSHGVKAKHKSGDVKAKTELKTTNS